MAEYIEREWVLSAFGEEPMIWIDEASEVQANDDWHTYTGIVKAAPAADVVEVRHGRWIPIKVPNQWDKGKCSACSCVFTSSVWGTAYCPNCGARMDGE